MKWTLCFFLAVSSFLSAAEWEYDKGDGFTVRVVLRMDKAMIGDRVELSIYHSHPSTFHIDHKAIERALIANSSSSNPIQITQTKHLDGELRYSLVAWSPGFYAISPEKIVFQSPSSKHTVSGPLFELEITPKNFEVNTELISDPHMALHPGSQVQLDSENREALEKEIQSQDSLERKQKVFEERQFPWIIFTILLVCAGSILVIRRYGNTWKEKLLFYFQPKVSPQQEALNRIYELRSSRLHHEGKIDAFFVEATSIVRNYIEKRFSIRAPEQTTPEFLTAMNTNSFFSGKTKEDLVEFLETADSIKFAKKNNFR